DGGSIIEAEIHLTKRPKLFRQTEPPLRASVRAKNTAIVPIMAYDLSRENMPGFRRNCPFYYSL
ncbi:hypothetical protein ABVB70_26885, partial [Agrobacterium radiobacter]